MNTRSRRIAAVAAMLLAGCAPDEFKPSPGFDGFLDQIAHSCYPNTIGTVLVNELARGGGSSNAGFMDATSKLYYGRMNPSSYRQFVTAFSDNSAATNRGIDCIVKYLPDQRPAASGGSGGMMSRDSVPPPPPQ